jgi:hypothetical protein
LPLCKANNGSELVSSIEGVVYDEFDRVEM